MEEWRDIDTGATITSWPHMTGAGIYRIGEPVASARITVTVASFGPVEVRISETAAGWEEAFITTSESTTHTLEGVAIAGGDSLGVIPSALVAFDKPIIEPSEATKPHFPLEVPQELWTDGFGDPVPNWPASGEGYVAIAIIDLFEKLSERGMPRPLVNVEITVPYEAVGVTEGDNGWYGVGLYRMGGPNFSWNDEAGAAQGEFSYLAEGVDPTRGGYELGANLSFSGAEIKLYPPTVVITAVSPYIVWDKIGPIEVEQYAPINIQLTATAYNADGTVADLPYDWSGYGVNGVNLSETGLITGSISTTGEQTLTGWLSLYDENGSYITDQPLTIVFNATPGSSKVTIPEPGPLTWKVGEPVNFFLTASVQPASAGPVTMLYWTGTLPPGVSTTADGATVTFSGTPTQAGQYDPVLLAYDTQGGETELRLSITVEESDKPEPENVLDDKWVTYADYDDAALIWDGEKYVGKQYTEDSTWHELAYTGSDPDNVDYVAPPEGSYVEGTIVVEVPDFDTDEYFVEVMFYDINWDQLHSIIPTSAEPIPFKVFDCAIIGIGAQPENRATRIEIRPAGIEPPLESEVTIQDPGTQNLKVGEPYSLSVTAATDLPEAEPVAIAVEGELPEGLIATPSDGALEITGTPTLEGTYRATFVATDALDSSASVVVDFLVAPAGPEPDPEPDPDEPLEPAPYRKGINYNLQDVDDPHATFARHFTMPLFRYIVTPRGTEDLPYLADLNFYEEPLATLVPYLQLDNYDTLEIFWLRKRVLFTGIQILIDSPAPVLIQPVTDSGLVFDPIDCRKPSERIYAIGGGLVADSVDLLSRSVIIEEPDYLGIQILAGAERIGSLGMRVQLAVSDMFDWTAPTNRRQKRR